MHEQTPQDQSQSASGVDASVPQVGRFKQLAISLIVGAVIITGSVVYSVGGQGSDISMLMLLAVVVMLAGSAALVDLIGYRTRALTPGTPRAEARHASIVEYQQRAVIRFALIEAPLLVAVALAYVLDGGVTIPLVLCGAGVVVLMYLHVYPREETVAKTEQSLQREGASSYLREAMFGDAAHVR